MITTETPPDPINVPVKRFGRLRGIVLSFALAVCLVFLATSLSGTLWFTHNHLLQLPAANSSQVENGVSARLDALEQKTAELSDKINALQSRSPAITSSVGLSTQQAPSLSATDVARLQSDYVAMAASLAALQKQMQQADNAAATVRDSAQSMLASLIAFLQLRDAALSGHGFSAELSSMRNASKSDGPLMEQLAKLDPYAAKGAPTDTQLREELSENEQRAITATEKAQAEHWWDRIWIEIKGLVTIRSLHGGGMTATFVAIDQDLDESDEHEALENFKKLWPESQEVLAGWKGKLEARDAIDDTMRTITSHFTAATTSPVSGGSAPIPSSPAP